MANEIYKILILRFSSLGDIVMTTAMIRCLRQQYPNAQIDMVVRSDYLDVIRHNPHLDQKIGLERGQGVSGLLSLLKRINREGYDLVYDAHRSLRTRFLMPKIQATHKAYFEKHYIARSLALTFKFPPLKDRTRTLERTCQPLEPYGVKYDGGGPEMFLPPGLVASLEERFAPSSKPTLGFIPSAQWPGKRWPANYFRSVLEQVIEKTPWQVIVFGGPGDQFCQEITQGFSEQRVMNVQGKLNLMESSALLLRCQLVLANDTGLMHIADALDIPSVLMLGPTSGELGCLPYHPLSHVLEQELWCRPCSKNGQGICIRGRRVCLEGISPSEAMNAVQKVMRHSRETNGEASL